MHGSKLKNCSPDSDSTQKIPGLFANLEHEDNLSFIEKWLPLGEYFSSVNTSDPDIFYLDNLDSGRRQYLWTYYPYNYNEDVYAKIIIEVCQDSGSMNNTLNTYGIDCSLYNSVVFNTCQNGDLDEDNFEKFGVNCSTIYSSWTDWSECSAICGHGIRTRKRECIEPGDCNGPLTDEETCTNQSPHCQGKS